MEKRTESADKRARVDCAECVACIAAKAAMENIRDDLQRRDEQKLAEIRQMVELVTTRLESTRNSLARIETRSMQLGIELDRLRGAIQQALAD